MIKMQSSFVDLFVNQSDQSSIEEEWGQPILGKLGKKCSYAESSAAMGQLILNIFDI